MTDHIPVHSPDSRQSASENGHITNQTINLGGPTLVVVILLACIIGACGVVMGLNLSKQSRLDEDAKATKTQLWLVERRLMDKEALEILHGDKLASDTQYGPTGNLQRMKPKR